MDGVGAAHSALLLTSKTSRLPLSTSVARSLQRCARQGGLRPAAAASWGITGSGLEIVEHGSPLGEVLGEEV